MFGAIKKSLTRTREGVFGKITRLLRSSPWDDAVLSQLEETLLQGDVGVPTTEFLIRTLRQNIKPSPGFGKSGVEPMLKEEIRKLLEGRNGKPSSHPEIPQVLMVVGVNGTGKTTTIAKLAYHYQQKGRSVLLAAADTFRAAAIDQLEIWAKRAGCELIKHKPDADPAAVAFHAVQAGISRKKDFVIVDTAGRLHNKSNLMEELKKIRRSIAKVLPSAPHEVWLVLDATTGQNAISQARQFTEAVGITGILLTKLDGTAKGGIVLAIRKELGIPVRYIGTGETIDALEEFHIQEFVDGLFELE